MQSLYLIESIIGFIEYFTETGRFYSSSTFFY